MIETDPTLRNALPELLAPAGDIETLRVAVRNGADAVYFGAQTFNARTNAANFDDEQIIEAVDYLHEHSARAYLTLNTLVSDEESGQALHIAENAWMIGADALIVQDVGLLCAIHRYLPDLPLFASTQMSIGNEPGILAARDLGLSRVILPRELTAESVRRLTAYAATIGMETEVFIHGALCVSFSGQCLMSALQGGRSANRGACAQPCRLPYRLSSSLSGETGESYPRLSLRDQSLYGHLDALAAAGVASLKIEGRMRSSAYVGPVVAAYRRMLDGSPDEEDPGRLLQAFNRGGAFMDAFYTDQRGPKTRSGSRPGSFGVYIGSASAIRPDTGILDIACPLTVESGQRVTPMRGDVLAIRRGAEDIASAPAGIVEQIASGFRIKGFHPDALRTVRVGDALYRMTDALALRAAEAADVRKTGVDIRLVSMEDGSARLVAVCSTMTAVRPSRSPESITVLVDHVADDVPPLPESRILAQLSKTGGTPFSVHSVSCDHPVPSLGVASLNAMRRDALEALRLAIHSSYRRPKSESREIEAGFPHMTGSANPGPPLSTPAVSPEIVVFYWQWPADGKPACGADIYLIPFRELDLPGGQGQVRLRALKAEEPHARITAVLPPGFNGPELERVSDVLDGLCASGLDGVASRTIDIHTMFTGFERSLEPGGNTFNTASFRCHASKGLSRVCVSHEVGRAAIRELLEAADGKCRAELTVYGRACAMFSHSCPVGGNACADPTHGVCRNAAYHLADERGRRFPVVCHPGPCTVEILSAQPIDGTEFLAATLASNVAIGHSNIENAALRFAFYDEPASFRRELITNIRALIDPAASVSVQSQILKKLSAQMDAKP